LLIDQTYVDLKSRGVHFVEKFHTGTHPGVVIKSLHEHLTNKTRKAQVVITTHEAFDSLPYFNRPEDWILIFDEVPKAIDQLSTKTTVVHKFLTNNLQLIDVDNYARLILKHRGEIQKIFDNEHDDASFQAVHDLVGKLLNEGWDTYTNRDRYKSLVAGVPQGKVLEAYTIRSPFLLQKFERCIVVAANFADTFFSHVMKFQKWDFLPYHGTPSILNDNHHNNGNLLTVYYLNIRKWSKTTAKSYPNILINYIDHIKNLFGNDDFIWLGNADGLDHFAGTSGIKLSGSPHGLNSYKDIDDAAVLGAFNPDNPFASFMTFIGMSRAQIDAAMHISSAYQGVLRGSLRDRRSTTPKRVVLPDVTTANWFLAKFPGAKLIPIPVNNAVSIGKVGRPALHASNAEKMRAYRLRKKAANDAAEGKSANRKSEPVNEPDSGYETTIVSDKVTNSLSGYPYLLNLYNSITSNGADDYRKFNTVDEMSKWFRLHSAHTGTSKFDNGLFNTSLVKSGLINANPRALNDIEYVHSLVFDIDGGDLSPDEFAGLFPNVRMFAHNTYSSTLHRPRYRVIVPTNRYMTVREHELCWMFFFNRIVDAGYITGAVDFARPGDKAHGIDAPKRVVNSIFLLPCQAEASGCSFFHDYNGEARGVLDVDEWMRLNPHKHLAVPLTKTVTVIPPPSNIIVPAGSDDKVDRAVERFRTVGTLPGHGDKELMTLAVTLDKAGLAHDDIKDILLKEVLQSTSPRHRTTQVARIMKTMGGPNWV